MSRLHPAFQILSQFSDGALGAGDQTLCQEHLGHCADCRARLASIGRVKTALRALPPVEENPLQQLQPPIFIPVVRPAFPLWGFVAGIAIGMVSIAILVTLRPVQIPMQIVSSRSGELQPGSALDVPDLPTPGDIDLEIPDQVFLRLKPGTTVTWQEMDRLWLFGGRPNIVLNVMRGEVLARTQDRFWGSKLLVRTPTANATVKGTAFSVAVDPTKESATTLKVLAGSVFFSPYLNPLGVDVRAGEEGRVEGRRLTEKPKPLSIEEKKRLLETYRIGQAPLAALVIGGGPERLEELLKPALLFVGLQPHPQMQPFLPGLVRKINQGILDGDLAACRQDLKSLEIILEDVTDPELAVPLRLYVGACDAQLGQTLRATLHFRWITQKCPEHPLASLAWAARGTIYQNGLNDPDAARTCFGQILARYSRSPEAPVARKALEALRSQGERGI